MPLYTPTQYQTIKDLHSGSNTIIEVEPTVRYKKSSLKIHTKMVCRTILISNFNFSDN